MEIASPPAVIELIRVLPLVPVVRDALPARSRPKDWLAPSAIGRGCLIDLVV
jgi:hypothetical protein